MQLFVLQIKKQIYDQIFSLNINKAQTVALIYLPFIQPPKMIWTAPSSWTVLDDGQLDF